MANVVRVPVLHNVARGLLKRRLSTQTSKDAVDALPKQMLERTEKQPSRIRAVFFGFLAGLATSSSVGYYFFRDEILQTESAVVKEMQALAASVESVASSVEKIEKVQSELNSLKAQVTKKEDLELLRLQFEQEKDHLELTLAEHKDFVLDGYTDMATQIDMLRKRRQNNFL
eukprot:m.52487 g.52487  ORF g.52487 m.52487 type:complete len:172 (-) comp21615_c1_seq2:392-907(-)